MPQILCETEPAEQSIFAQKWELIVSTVVAQVRVLHDARVTQQCRFNAAHDAALK